MEDSESEHEGGKCHYCVGLRFVYHFKQTWLALLRAQGTKHCVIPTSSEELGLAEGQDSLVLQEKGQINHKNQRLADGSLKSNIISSVESPRLMCEQGWPPLS